jgi:hypothetical protein
LGQASVIAFGKETEGKKAWPKKVVTEGKRAEDGEQKKDNERSYDTNQPGTQDQLKRMNRSNEDMLHRFRPEVIEERLCNVNLTDLDHTHGDNPYEDETGHVWIQTEEVRQKPYGKETNQFGGCALDGFNILVTALKMAGEDKNKLRDAIEQTKGYVGIHGIFNYSASDHGGITKDSILMYQATGGTWNIIK